MNREVCKTVNTTHNKQKIVVHGYLLVKDKNRDESFYWCCEHRDSRNCKGRAVTTLEGQIHILKKFSEHNHAPEPSHVDVIQALNNIKELASQTHEKPSQIIHDATIEMPEDSFYYMSNSQALHKQISHIQLRNLPSQPQTLQEIDIPIQLQTTIRGERFLAREIDIDNEKIMIFCTSNNLLHLEEANYWLMDGTFKTVPTLFRQLYTIHAPVGGESNFRVFPLVYIIMMNQLEESYKRVFQELLNLSKEADYNLSPPVIITDFEQSVINAVQSKFSNSTHKAIEYGSNEAFSLRLRHLAALAFLPPLEIPVAFDTIKPMMPSNTTEIINYFENTYIYGRIRQQLQNEVTTLHELVENGFPRTQNLVEGWHNRWNNIVEKMHLGTYTIIKEMCKEQQQVDMQIERVLRGEPHPTQQKCLIDYERRILSVFNNHDTYTLVDFLR
ncbi:7196_t:CDS:2, partial [Gigaspora rosea]